MREQDHQVRCRCQQARVRRTGTTEAVYRSLEVQARHQSEVQAQ